MIRKAVTEPVDKYALADMLGVPTSSVRGWLDRWASTGFPAPVRGSGVRGDPYLYDPDQVSAWHEVWCSTRKGRERRVS